MLEVLRGLSLTATAFGVTCIVAAMAGDWVPALDSLRIVSPYVAVAVLLWVVVGMGLSRRTRLAAATVSVIGLWPVVALSIPGEADLPAGPTIRLLQHNVHFSNPMEDLSSELTGFDIATLQETDSAGVAFASLPPAWTVRTCASPLDVRTAIVSRLDVVATGCFSGGETWMRVRTPGGEVTVVSVHLVWPWPAGGDAQAQQVARLSKEVAPLAGPTIIAGDFNQMPWSAAVADIAKASDTQLTSGVNATFIKKSGYVRLPIDHVLVPRGWDARVAVVGSGQSDHEAVGAVIAVPPRG